MRRNQEIKARYNELVRKSESIERKEDAYEQEIDRKRQWRKGGKVGEQVHNENR